MMWASAMSRSLRFGSFSKQLVRSTCTLRGVDGGSPAQSGSCSRMAASVSVMVSSREGCAARQHLVKDTAERPDVGALVDGLSARLLRAHVGRGAEDHALACRADGHRGRV